MVQTATLPAGVRLHPLRTHSDDRGSMTELFREEWGEGVRPLQWNIFRSAAGVLRGVHVHVVHDDVAIILEGRMTLGLRDVRETSPTCGLSVALDLSGEARSFVVIPRGVLHGFFFHEATTLLVGVTSYYDPTDDVPCLWSDADLNIPWGVVPTLVSERDATAPPFSEFLERIRPWQPFAFDEAGSEVSFERAGRIANQTWSR